MSERKSASFAEMLRASLGRGTIDGVSSNAQGGNFRLPLARAAVIESSDVGGRERLQDGVSWLAGDAADSPIMSRLNIIPTSQTRGKIASGSVLPMTSMQGQSGTSALERGTSFPTSPAPRTGDLFRFTSAAIGIVAVDEDGTAITEAETDQTFRFNGTSWERQASTFGEHEFGLDSVVESKSEVSLEVAIQTADDTLDMILEAHRLAISDRLLGQVLAGDGVGENLNGVASASGLGVGSYPLADMGSDEFFTDGEISVQDAGGRSQFVAWGLGATLSTAARKVAIEPGGSRRVEEMGRLTLSGTPVQRITEGLAGTTGLCGDWRTVTVPILSSLIIVVDRITIPGFVRITSRLPVASPILTHPSAIYALTQA